MTLEATCWLRDQGVTDGHEQWQRNRDAIADCITRAVNSTWWDWSDGSRLFFWRWPDPWRLEARDGAKSYRMAEPPHRRHFPRVPVVEPWIGVNRWTHEGHLFRSETDVGDFSSLFASALIF